MDNCVNIMLNILYDEVVVNIVTVKQVLWFVFYYADETHQITCRKNLHKCLSSKNWQDKFCDNNVYVRKKKENAVLITMSNSQIPLEYTY